jgi:thymidylate synthase
MKPVNERTVDTQYRTLLMRILAQGEKVDTQQEEAAVMVLGHQMRFDLTNGFPLITERDLSGRFFTGAIGELLCFLSGGQTQKDLVSHGCSWWKRWITPEKCAKRGLKEGDLGPGSYGAVWRRFPTAEGEAFDQITTIIQQIREKPHLRTHMITNWAPQYTARVTGRVQKVVVAPCHGQLHILIRNGKLSLHHIQRSADTPVGLVFNMAQYAALALMLGQVLGYPADELVYTISDAHIYVKQIEAVHTLLSREPRSFPTLTINPDVTDIFQFKPEDFTISDYNPHEEMRIWTPV